MMTNERRAFGRPIILTIVTTLCIFCSAAVGQTQKVRSGESSSIQCQNPPQGSTYRWTIDGREVTSDLTGIDSESIQSNRIRIDRMTQQLAGEYQCFLDGDTQPLNTVRLFIVGIAEYSNCPEPPCFINHTYSPSDRQFILNATIIFINSGVECCNENLSISVWTVKPTPDTTVNSTEVSRNNSKTISPPGINIAVQTSNDLTSNIAMVNITNANTAFQIVHMIHRDVVGGNSLQLILTFNFNYTGGPSTSTPSPSLTSSSSLTTVTTSMSPTLPVTSETSSSSPTVESSTTPAVTMTTKMQPPNTTSDSNVTPTPTSGAGPVSQDEDNNTGVIVGVVVAIIVLAIIGAVVAAAVVWWYRCRDKNRADLADTRARGAPTSGNHRPTTLSYSERPLLHNNINTYTCGSTTTATPLNGAYGLPPDPAGQESNHQNDEEDVQDHDFDDEKADSGSVTVQF